MNGLRKHQLVLSIYCNTRGFAYALFEGPFAPVDWGVMEARGEYKNRRCLRRISGLFGQYQPDLVLLQDMSEKNANRARRIRELNEAIETLAETQAISTAACSRSSARAYFAQLGAVTKHEIAQVIAKHIPAFERLIPRARKPWMNEDAKMGIFDAAALAMTFYCSQPK